MPGSPTRAAVAAAVLAAGLLTAGCSGTGHPSTLGSSASRLSSGSPQPGRSHIRQYLSHTPPTAPSGQVSSGPTPNPSTAPPTAPGGAPVAAGPGPCPASQLRVSIGAADGAAGSIYYPLEFTNESGATCTLYGYPGVSFATGPGAGALGGPAVRNPSLARELVSLAPGATAHAALQVAVAQSYPAALCKPVTAHWLQVFPPASYVADYIAFTALTCTGNIPNGTTLGIYVVRPGATGP